jgi:hypothetical protein
MMMRCGLLLSSKQNEGTIMSRVPLQKYTDTFCSAHKGEEKEIKVVVVE